MLVVQLPLVALDTHELRKARGAFFTPASLCAYISHWAIRTAADRVLEPSCGDAAFLAAAARRLDELGAPPELGQLVGVELHEDSAEAARAVVARAGRSVRVEVADFFDFPVEPRYDAVIGNPPYVRYQGFSGAARASAQRAALAAGVGLTALASSWAAFTVHAAQCVRPGGRLGLVLPGELLTVNYAAAVRRFLMERFGGVRLVVFTERVFPGVLEEVVLLLAEDALAAGRTTASCTRSPVPWTSPTSWGRPRTHRTAGGRPTAPGNGPRLSCQPVRSACTPRSWRGTDSPGCGRGERPPSARSPAATPTSRSRRRAPPSSGSGTTKQCGCPHRAAGTYAGCR